MLTRILPIYGGKFMVACRLMFCQKQYYLDNTAQEKNTQRSYQLTSLSIFQILG
jgi:hypothetical protein